MNILLILAIFWPALAGLVIFLMPSCKDNRQLRGRAVNAALAKSEGGLPMVTVSAGAAFSDRAEPVGSIFEDADAALYQRKEHGKAGCAIFGT